LNKKDINFIQKQHLLIKKYDPTLIEHNISVAKISYLLGLNSNKLNFQQLSNLYFSALIHDIGKIFLSKKVLNKPDRLNSKEMQYVQQHSSFGADYIEQCFYENERIGLESSQKNKIIFHIRHHHEHLDGSGYPNNLKTKLLPLTTQILTIADVYSALNEKRVYKNSWNNEEIFDYLKSNSSQWFNKRMIYLLEDITKAQQKKLVNN